MGSISGQEDPLEEGMATHSSSLTEGFHGQRSLTGYTAQCYKVKVKVTHSCPTLCDLHGL